MVGAYEIHLHTNEFSTIVKNISEIMKHFPGNVKTFIFVNKSITYLLFRFYTTDELMIKADAAMRTARTERLELGQQYSSPRREFLGQV